MPDTAIGFAKGISEVRTPTHLVSLRTQVRKQNRAELEALHATIHDRYNHIHEDCMNVFYAAAEMALMERVGRDELPAEDRRKLRQLWQALLTAR
jgi:hypothetical protein